MKDIERHLKTKEELIEMLRPELEFDLKISRQMVNLIVDDTPLRRWHSDRISYLESLLTKEAK